MTTTEAKPMTIEATGKNVVLFGSIPETGKWFERHYPNTEAARKFADKRGWAVEVKGAN